MKLENNIKNTWKMIRKNSLALALSVPLAIGSIPTKTLAGDWGSGWDDYKNYGATTSSYYNDRTNYNTNFGYSGLDYSTTQANLNLTQPVYTPNYIEITVFDAGKAYTFREVFGLNNKLLKDPIVTYHEDGQLVKGAQGDTEFGRDGAPKIYNIGPKLTVQAPKDTVGYQFSKRDVGDVKRVLAQPKDTNELSVQSGHHPVTIDYNVPERAHVKLEIAVNHRYPKGTSLIQRLQFYQHELLLFYHLNGSVETL